MKSVAKAQLQMDISVNKEKGTDNKFINFLRDNKMIILLFVGIIIIVSALAPEFWKVSNITTVLRQASIVGIVAVGMTFVIISAGIDLSVGSVLSLCGVIFAYFMSSHFPIWIAIVLTILIGIGVGIINGIGATFFGIQPFIMTLATMSIGTGLALIICTGTPIAINTSSSFLDLIGNGYIAGTNIPGATLIFLLAALVAGIVLRKLSFGRFVYGVGGSLETARLSGVKTTRILILVYAISGLCAALAGVIQTSQIMTGDPNAGNFVMLDSIAAVVIGGTSLMGGRGSIAGTIAGVLLLSIVSNFLNLMGVSSYYQNIVKGIIILLAIVTTSKGLKERIKQQWSGL